MLDLQLNSANCIGHGVIALLPRVWVTELFCVCVYSYVYTRGLEQYLKFFASSINVRGGMSLPINSKLF